MTLVEMLIALALLGFVLIGITPLFMASVKSNVAGNEYTSIHVLARDRLEQLMNLKFQDEQLSPGKHVNDLPTQLPDPRTGLPGSGPGSVRNPFKICYQISQFQIPAGDTITVPKNASFTPIPVAVDKQVFQYKRIDVTVTAGIDVDPLKIVRIGSRRARVSGVLSNPAPESITSLTDPTAPGTAGTCD